MLQKTRGIVFRTIKFSETSVVSKIYTEKFGIQSYIVNGVRSSKSKVKASLLQSLSLLEMEVYYREHRNLNRIKEFQPSYVFSSLPFDALKSSVGLFMIEVLNKCIREEETNEKLFQFIFKQIKGLDEIKSVPSGLLLSFLLQLALLLGFQVHGEFSETTPYFHLREGSFVSVCSSSQYYLSEEDSRQLSSLIKNQKIHFSSLQRKSLLHGLLKYYQLHVPNFTFPKSLNVLEEVFK